MAQRIARGRKKRRARIHILPILHLAVTLVLAIALIVVSADRAKLQDKVQELSAQGQQGQSAGEGTTSSEVASGPTASQLQAMAEADQWYLKVVNYENVLPSDYNIETELINSKYARSHHRFDVRAMDALKSMCVAAEEDGIDLFMIAAHRTYNNQVSLYNAEVQEWLDAGYSQQDAEDKASTFVARPGTSEHHLGLAADFNSVEQNFDQTATFRWLRDNAEEYGFVMRYPKNKQEITKVTYEPWHYRYVGVEHAKAMNDLGYCLEEYVEYLKNGGVQK